MLFALQAVRDKRTPSAKDKLPEEVFLRLRGSLFFGPSFLVTRNKLSFRDNLQQLLADASPGEIPLQPGELLGGISKRYRPCKHALRPGRQWCVRCMK